MLDRRRPGRGALLGVLSLMVLSGLSASASAQDAPGDPAFDPANPTTWDQPDSATCPAAGGADAPFTTEGDVAPDAALVLNGGGWGHSVGMSQYGANGAASLGCSTATILQTYYPGIAFGAIDPPRDSLAIHLLKRGLQSTTIRTTGAQYGGADLPWLACDIYASVCPQVALVPAGEEWTVTPFSDGTLVLAVAGTDPSTCPVTAAAPAPAPTPTPTPSPTATATATPTPTATATPAPAGCRWRGGDLETRLRLDHDGSVIRIVEANGRRVKWGFTEFDYSSKDGGTTYVTQYVTGADDGSVTAVDRYLWGLGEVPSSWEPAALRAQAIAGRSYAEATIRTRESVFGRHAQGNYIDRNECRCDLFATTVDQVYLGFDHEEAESGAWNQAVTQTRGVHALYDGVPIAAFYSSSHGGWSEDVEHVWGTAIAYLPAVDASRWEAAAARDADTPWGNPRYRWTASFTASELSARFGMGSVTSFEIIERGPGGRPTRLNGGGIEVVGTDVTGAPATLHMSGETLRSKLSIYSALVYTPGEAPDEPVLVDITPACPPDDVPEDGYSDIPDGAEHETAIDCLTWWGVTDGRGDGTYGASDVARRDEMAGALVDVLVEAGVTIPAEPADHFTDDNSNPYQYQINVLAEMGLVLGVGNGRYNPSGPVVRANMASFEARVIEHILQRELADGGDPFSDDNGNTHEANIGKLHRAGVVAGFDDGTYQPNRSLTRAQLASFTARSLALMVNEGRAVPPSQREAQEEPASDGTPEGAARFVVFSGVGGVQLLEPSEHVDVIGYHESGHEGAQQLEPSGAGPRSVTMESRNRGTGSRTAADVVVEPDTPLYAPVSGSVVRAGTYTLYCEYSDDYVVIDPDQHPGWEVKLLHIDGVMVAPGDRVEAGITMLAPRATLFPFESQVDEFSTTGDWPHTHIEVIDPSIPNEPSGGGC